LVIGRGGATVKSIAKDAKDACRIQFIKGTQGTFEISAYSSKAILFAEIKIKELLQGKVSSKKKSTNTNKDKLSSKGNVFSHLSLLEEEEEVQEVTEVIPKKLGNCTLLPSKKEVLPTTHTSSRKKSKKTTLLTNFTLSGGSIRDRKRERYFSRKNLETQRSNNTTTTQSIPSEKDFPENPSFRKMDTKKEVTDWSFQNTKKNTTTLPEAVQKIPPPPTVNKITSTKLSSLDDDDEWGDEETLSKANNPFQNEIDNWEQDEVHTRIVFA
jgi:hypothetical protein